MKIKRSNFRFALFLAVVCWFTGTVQSQTLINIDFGVGSISAKRGFAASGQSTNDFWNLYSHYQPRFVPGTPLIPDGRLDKLKMADGSDSSAGISVLNAPGVWGNASGDPMFDSYVFALNGSNIVLSIHGLEAGRYHFYFYGHADPDVAAEQNSVFTVVSGTNKVTTFAGSNPVPGIPSGAHGWREGANFSLVRDLPVSAGAPVVIEVAPSSGGVAVLNGLQILSRGTAPPRRLPSDLSGSPNTFTNLLLQKIHYEGSVNLSSARFNAVLEAEAQGTNEISAQIFEGDLALLAPKLPPGWRIVNQDARFYLVTRSPGAHRIEFEIVAKIGRVEPWNVISFKGPDAAISTVSVKAAVPDTEFQLGTGMVSELKSKGSLHGVLGNDSTLSLRWQSKTEEIKRDAALAVASTIAARITPTSIHHRSKFLYEIRQGRVSDLKIQIPSGQSMTKIEGEQVRDWQIKNEGGLQWLTVEFIRPQENQASIDLFTEQSVSGFPVTLEIVPPAPAGVHRETGRLSILSEDVVTRIETTSGLRQVNAQGTEALAFSFSGRPASARVNLSRVEPALSSVARVFAFLEENRWLIRHELKLSVARAGIYFVELTPQPDLTITDVIGDGVENWEMVGKNLRINFGKRVLGDRALTVQMEGALAGNTTEVVVLPLKLAGAEKETAFIGAGAVPGVELKTGTLDNLREIPVSALPMRKDELLAFRAEKSSWRLVLNAQKLSARLTAEIFNLLTVGDGVVGGSATVRYRIENQGVQQFRVRLPAHWRNIEFIGLNLRRKDQAGDVWNISLQDKVWGGYTLVITYDFAFEPRKARIDGSGAHALDVQRETGTLALTSAAGLVIQPEPLSEPLRAMDPSELAETDRALISRTVLYAYRYEGSQFALNLNLTRHNEVPMLDAVADRAQLTSVLTESGEMLTQASFMVKNNERQFQRFQLPVNASLWGVSVNGEPTKVDRDGDWLLISLPRNANRDLAFAVEIKYAQKMGNLGRILPVRTELVAPKTDVPGTYAEWELFVPASRHVTKIDGNMTVARGATYGLREGWDEFYAFYRVLWHQYGVAAIFGVGTIAFFMALILHGRRKGFAGIVSVMAIFAIIAILAGMLLPALSKAKARAQRLNSVSNLKQIGVAARLFANDHEGRLPVSFEEMMNELSSHKVLVDPESGERYTYLGAGKSETDPTAILAHTSSKNGRREVLMADGSVQMVSENKFADMLAAEAVSQRQNVDENRYGKTEGSALAFGEGAVRSTAAQPVVSAPAAPAEMKESLADLPASAPLAEGVRSLKFDLPKSGKAIQFTRVLNLSGDPQTISISMMSGKVATGLHLVFQLTAFLTGLGMVLFQWRRTNPKPFWMALGAGLALAGTMHLFITWKALHLVMIIAFPAFVLAFAVWIGLRIIRNSRSRERDTSAPPPVSPAAAILVVGLCTWSTHAQVSSPAPRNLPQVMVQSAVYTGKTTGNSALLEGKYEIVSQSSNSVAWIFGPDVAIQSFSTSAEGARLFREGDRTGIFMAQPGKISASITFVVRVNDLNGRRQLDFALPSALGSQFSLLLDEPDAEIEFPAAVTFSSRAEEQNTRVEAVLGAQPRTGLLWTPRLKRASEVAATIFVQQSSLITLSSGLASIRSVMDYQISQGEIRQLRLSIPEGQRVMKISGEMVRSWNSAPTNSGEVVVELLKNVTGNTRVIVESESGFDQLPITLSLFAPRAMDVKRVAGFLAVGLSDDLAVTVDHARGLERIDSADFIRQWGDVSSGIFSSWRFLQPGFELGLRLEFLKPRLHAAVQHHFLIGTDQIAAESTIDYTVDRAGIFKLQIAVPNEAQIQSVKCESMQAWSGKNDGQRILEISLAKRTVGAIKVEISTIMGLTNLSPALILKGIEPLNVEKISGFVSVEPEPGVGLKTVAISNLTEIPTTALLHPRKNAQGLLAYKILQGGQSLTWSATVAVEVLEAWVRAEVMNSMTVGETLLQGRAIVRFDIQNSPVREFRLRVPAEFQNVQITGSGIRRKDQTNGVWRVELQNKVRGEYRLALEWQLPRNVSTNDLAIAGIEAMGVERETGSVLFQAQAPLQLTQKTITEDLIRIDAGELPAWAQELNSGNSRAALVYRYLRPGWKLTLGVERFREAALLQALVESARLKTVVADDGQMITQLGLMLRNNGRQHLELTLPEGARLWAAFVSGQPVRPSEREGRLLLRLEASGRETAIPIEITYVNKGRFPKSRGKVELISPRLDVPLKDAQWEVFLPPDYDYDSFGGSMTYERADLVPLAQDFTIAEYSRQESAKKAGAEAEAADLLKKAQIDFLAGNLNDTGNKLNLFRRDGLSRATAGEIKKLEDDLNRAQSSNLLTAQKKMVESSSPYLERTGPTPEARSLGLDVKIVEQQVAQLQKAQALSQVRLTPLRVNLPTRGLRHAFVQVLQTEVNVPLTISLKAVNDREMGWATRLALGAAGFLALYLLSILAVRKCRSDNRG